MSSIRIIASLLLLIALLITYVSAQADLSQKGEMSLGAQIKYPPMDVKNNEKMQIVLRQEEQEGQEVIPTTLYDLTGMYYGVPSGVYFVRQIGDRIFWFGEYSRIAPTWANVACGALMGNTINVNWADVPKDETTSLNSGTAELIISVQENKIILTTINQMGGFQTIEMRPARPMDYTLSLP